MATLTWGKGEIKRWICEHKVRGVPAPEPNILAVVPRLRVHDLRQGRVDPGLFGSGHKRFVRVGLTAEGPAGRPSC